MFRHTLTAAATAIALGALAVACSSPPTTPGVASLGSPTTTNTSTPTGSGSKDNAYANFLKFSQCMRAHGLPTFPDPGAGGDGGIGIRLDGIGLNPDSPTFQRAQQACHALLPGGGPGGAATTFDPTKIGAWAQCMRQHGLPNLPDPKNTGKGMSLDLSGTKIDPDMIGKAMQACKSKSPGGTIEVSGNGFQLKGVGR